MPMVESCRQLEERICQTRFLLVPHPRSLYLDKCTECRDMKATRLFCFAWIFLRELDAGRGAADTTQLNFRPRNFLWCKGIFPSWR